MTGEPKPIIRKYCFNTSGGFPVIVVRSRMLDHTRPLRVRDDP